MAPRKVDSYRIITWRQVLEGSSSSSLPETSQGDRRESHIEAQEASPTSDVADPVDEDSAFEAPADLMSDGPDDIDSDDEFADLFDIVSFQSSIAFLC
jgi:hypothetical protein